MMKRIVLCADDYGQAPGISKGILTLIEHERLSATSCMVNSPYWMEHAKWLRPWLGKVDIGLHFNLTEGRPLSQPFRTAYGETFFPLKAVMQKAFLRQLDKEVLAAECQAQLNAFREGLGSWPDFVDGHHHIHQLPVVREGLLAAYQQQDWPKKPYIRVVNAKLMGSHLLPLVKKLIIMGMGSKSLQHLLQKNKIPFNQTFSGIYHFSAKNYAESFSQFLTEIDDLGIIMCHPGLPDPSQDTISQARQAEYSFLMSDNFHSYCKLRAIILSRFL